MDPKRKAKIIARYGEPFIKTKTALKVNQVCLCEMVKAILHIRYVRPLKKFERYSVFKGEWVNISEDDIAEVTRRVASAVAPAECDRGQISMALTYDVLANITKLIRISVGVNALPLPPCRFIHLRDCLLVFDRESKTLKRIPFSPDYNSRNRIDLPYNPAAKCPRFVNKLILPMLKNKSDLRLIQLYFGQCLLHENISQTFLIISGPAEVGKSVLVNIIEAVLGKNNVTELHPDRLSSPFELAEYASRSLLTAKDVENDALSANKINALMRQKNALKLAAGKA